MGPIVNKPGFKIRSLSTPIYMDSRFYLVGTPKLKVRLNNEIFVTTMINIRTEINIMTSKVAKSTGLAIRPNPNLNIISHSGHRRGFIGICEGAKVRIKGVTSYKPIFVVDNIDHKLILRQLFIFETRLVINKEKNKVYVSLKDPKSKVEVKAKVLKLNNSRNRL